MTLSGFYINLLVYRRPCPLQNPVSNISGKPSGYLHGCGNQSCAQHILFSGLHSVVIHYSEIFLFFFPKIWVNHGSLLYMWTSSIIPVCCGGTENHDYFGKLILQIMHYVREGNKILIACDYSTFNHFQVKQHFRSEET